MPCKNFRRCANAPPFSMPAGAKIPRKPQLPGEKGLFLKSAYQAISLTVMLTSGIASVALLTSISPERICSFSAS